MDNKIDGIEIRGGYTSGKTIELKKVLDKRRERFGQIQICNQMEQELINLKQPKMSLSLKLAKKKDLKEIRQMKVKLKNKRFNNG